VKNVHDPYSSADISKLNSIRVFLSTGAQLFLLNLVNLSMVLACAREQFPKILQGMV